jgi:cytochrome c biogenesis protein CcdA
LRSRSRPRPRRTRSRAKPSTPTTATSRACSRDCASIRAATGTGAWGSSSCPIRLAHLRTRSRRDRAAAEIAWQLPGARFGELAWPDRSRSTTITGLTSFGYDRPVLLAADAEVPRDARALAATVDALVCAHLCHPRPLRARRAARRRARRRRPTARARRAERESATRAARRAGVVARRARVRLLGGLVLNLMPCVLPVLAIKLAALAELAARSRREQLRHAAAYTGGIALSMLALAAVVAALRAAGASVGWGFQLQEPVFLVAIAALLVAFAQNLFGAFEISVDTSRLGGIGSDAPGAARSFFDGLLAVALATPCSAPFLGTAVGFAFASPAPVIAAIFLAIGLGLAAPFALGRRVARDRAPHPALGRVDGKLRVALGGALLLTVAWLLWILARVRGPERGRARARPVDRDRDG